MASLVGAYGAVLFVRLAHIGAVLGAALVAWLGWIVFEAWYEVVKAPRVDMYVCDKHGPVPKHLCIVFQEKEDKSERTEQQYQCPFCYEDAFKLADKTLREKERIRT